MHASQSADTVRGPGLPLKAGMTIRFRDAAISFAMLRITASALTSSSSPSAPGRRRYDGAAVQQ
jgi:hypothetical protein